MQLDSGPDFGRNHNPGICNLVIPSEPVIFNHKSEEKGDKLMAGTENYLLVAIGPSVVHLILVIN